jgi:hypothetical protein
MGSVQNSSLSWLVRYAATKALSRSIVLLCQE